MNMIYEFTFENYRSYRHEATIDFTAKPINEFEQSLINGNKRITFDGNATIDTVSFYEKKE